MTAQEILEEIKMLGGRLEARGDRLRVDVPAGALTPELKAALAEHKTEVLAVLTGDLNRDEWRNMPLSELERRHVAIKIRSDDYGTLWLVSTDTERELADSGDPTYTVEEARRMIGLPEPLVRQSTDSRRLS